MVYEDIEAAHAFLVDTPASPLADWIDADGRREYEARDLENHRWWFGTSLKVSRHRGVQAPVS